MTPSDRGTPPLTASHPRSLHELAPGLALARGGPGRTLNIYLLGSVVVDAGVRWSRHRLARQLAGRQVTAQVLTHAHVDHAGSSAWRCRTLGVPLWCGAGDAAAIPSGRVDTHGSPLVNRLQRTWHRSPPTRSAAPWGKAISSGVRGPGGPRAFPGCAGVLAGADRVLVCGDVLANLGLHPADPAWCWCRRRCRQTTSSIGVRRLAWPGCDPAGLLRPRLRGH